MPPPPTFEVRLARARMVSRSVRELSFERTDGSPLVFEAGQWVSLVLPQADMSLRRSYSIASAPRHSPGFEIAVTRVQGGPGSMYLHAMECGATLENYIDLKEKQFYGEYERQKKLGKP